MWAYMLPALERFCNGDMGAFRFVDLGSGYGDFVVRLLSAGAGHVNAVDKSMENLEIVRKKVEAIKKEHKCRLTYAYLDSKQQTRGLLDPSPSIGFLKPDIAICTSVLPYLQFPDDLLSAMAYNQLLSIVECQYADDGPGFKWIRDDRDMERWLKHHFRHVDMIGRTSIGIRPGFRTIWSCSGANL